MERLILEEKEIEKHQSQIKEQERKERIIKIKMQDRILKKEKFI